MAYAKLPIQSTIWYNHTQNCLWFLSCTTSTLIQLRTIGKPIAEDIHNAAGSDVLERFRLSACLVTELALDVVVA
jgi:hypothetical protein